MLELPPVTLLPPGATTRFTVRFKPTAGGMHAATVRVASSSPLQIPFEIGLEGTGITVPEIAIIQDNGADLKSGIASVSFGNCILGSTSPAHSFTIKNPGSAPLTNLSVASDDPDFIVGHFGTTTLAPGDSTTFQVNFQPSSAGARAAHLSIVSNDANESPFLIALTGRGIAAPEIAIIQNGGRYLKDEASIVNFGTVEEGSTGRGILFTIRNTGTANLENLALSKDGINPSDFIVGALRTTSLAPGSSATFKINFLPTNGGTRWAAIHIASNDRNEQSFDIVITGTGSPQSSLQPLSASAGIGNNPGIPASSVRGIEVIAGRKFLTLTLAKIPGATAHPRDVEVSSNLVEWSSGHTHTTVLIDNATTLKVRDNTPVTRDAKRYIRLKPTRR